MSLAFVFPGQGSQSIGMLKDLAQRSSVVKTVFNEASQRLGYDLWSLTQNGPEQELGKTEKTQPALLAAGVACWRLWQEAGGVIPVIVAGHSLGEYTALVCAGALEFSEAVTLVADRGRYMQEAVPEGTGSMAAILGLDDDKVVEICGMSADGQTVSAANFNAPGQVVIAGHVDAVNTAIAALRQAGARRAVVLPVSVPSHCALMNGATDRLAERLQRVNLTDAKIPVIQNVDAELRTDPRAIVNALIRQLHQPVRWSQSVIKMKSEGISRIVECGPGNVLTALCKRIDHDLDAVAVNDPESLDSALSRCENE